MPIHDWTLVEAGLFHAFRHRWLGALCDALNAGVLPEDHFALIEAARGADRIAVRHHRQGRTVAVVEIVSPEDKASDGALRGFVQTMAELIVGRSPCAGRQPLPSRASTTPRGSTRRSGTSWRKRNSSCPPIDG